jgi:cytochrome c oxidase subunit 2
MRGLMALTLVVALFLAGCGGSGGPGGPAARWIKAENLPPKAQPGARLFATAGCTACHTYAGSGAQNLGAPDLTAIGTRNLGIRFQIEHLKCPACVNPGSPMPKYDSLGETRLHQLAVFLEASKGTH